MSLKFIRPIVAISLILSPIFGFSSYFSDHSIIFSGNSNLPLSKEVAEYLGASLGEAKVGRFNDGEIQISVKDNVRNKDVYILQSNCPTLDMSVNDSIMELYLMVRTMKRASANQITAVIPYYGYARQDRKTTSRVPISAADIALMLEEAGVDRVVTIDLHCGQIQGFFQDIPVDNLYATNVFIDHFVFKNILECVVVSPDAGGVARAKQFMDLLNKRGIKAELAMISKQREKAGEVASMQLIGQVANKPAIIIDDICDTGGTLVKAAALLKDLGANQVFAMITHPVFSKNAVDLIEKSCIDEMFITNTVPLKKQLPSNITVLSVGPLIAEALKRIESGESVSGLFN
jgi:ribose-phosphate pyrophosphokinase